MMERRGVFSELSTRSTWMSCPPILAGFVDSVAVFADVVLMCTSNVLSDEDSVRYEPLLGTEKVDCV